MLVWHDGQEYNRVRACVDYSGTTYSVNLFRSLNEVRSRNEEASVLERKYLFIQFCKGLTALYMPVSWIFIK